MPLLIPGRVAACVLALALVGVACDGGSAAGSGTCSGEDVRLGAEDALVVGTDLAFPPMAFREGGEPSGFEIDLLRAVADRLNLELAVEHRGLSSLVPGLLADDYDLAASGLRPDPELRASACLTSPHLGARPTVVVPAGAAETITGPAELDGRPVGVEEGDAEASWARRELPRAGLSPLPTTDDLFDALAAGEVAAVVAERPVALARTAADEGLEVAFSGDAVGGYVFALHPENAGLRNAVADAIELLRDDGTYDELHERWFGRPPD